MIEDIVSDLLEDAIELATDGVETVIDFGKDAIEYVSENGGDELMSMAKTTVNTTIQAIYDRIK